MSESKPISYKKYYSGIFSLNYLTQGINQSMFTIIIPIYLILTLKTVDIASITSISSIAVLPWTMKLLYGILNDKFGSKKLGRRKPYIIFPSTVSGICWIIIPFTLQPISAITLFMIMAIIINIGYAIADTSTDGLIIDIVPKEQLGRTQGLCWSVRSIGIIVGGPLFAVLLYTFEIEYILILLGIITIVFSLLVILIKEDKTKVQVDLILNLKTIFKKRENWKVFLFSIFIAIVDGIVFLILSLFLFIQIGLVNPEGATISILEENVDLYLPQAFITLIVGLGIIIGAIIFGYLADKKSRKFAINFSFLSIFISFLLILIPAPLIILLIIVGILGISLGGRNGAIFAVLGEYSKKYPEMASTYFSICMSFSNIGTILGLTLTGFLFTTISQIMSDFLIIYGTVFIFMALIQNLGLLFFKFLNPNEYELKMAKSMNKSQNGSI